MIRIIFVLSTLLASTAWSAPFETYHGQHFSKAEGGMTACLSHLNQIKERMTVTPSEEFVPYQFRCESLSDEAAGIVIEYENKSFGQVSNTSLGSMSQEDCTRGLARIEQSLSTSGVYQIDIYCRAGRASEGEAWDWQLKMDYFSHSGVHKFDEYMDGLIFENPADCRVRQQDVENSFAARDLRVVYSYCVSYRSLENWETRYAVKTLYVGSSEEFLIRIELRKFDDAQQCSANLSTVSQGFERGLLPILTAYCYEYTGRYAKGTTVMIVNYFRKWTQDLQKFSGSNFQSFAECENQRTLMTNKFEERHRPVVYSYCAENSSKAFDLNIFYAD